MTRGQRNHNPLNIRKGNNWQGEHPTMHDSEFECFVSDTYGFRAAFIIIKNGFKASTPRETIRQIVTRWAPPSENDTESYVATISQRTNIHPDTRLTFSCRHEIVAIVKAMAWVESRCEYPDHVLHQAYDMAL